MSTRRTLWCSDEFHLYQEAFDEESVYLEVRNRPEVDQFILRIPLTAWKEMRQYTIEPAERYLGLSDEEMLAETEAAVDKHRSYLETLPGSSARG